MWRSLSNNIVNTTAGERTIIERGSKLARKHDHNLTEQEIE